jgi:threonine/homoserine/homoserine lactone efflux protein
MISRVVTPGSTMGDLVRNVLLGISLAAPIGPSGVAVIQNGLRRGFLRAFITGVGVTMADATYLLLVYFGLSNAISIPLIKILIWILGALVLFYLGAQSLQEAVHSVDLNKTMVPATRNPLLVGYLVNISNPIAVVWWLGVFGSLLGTAVDGTTKISVLLSSSTILIGILFWHSTVSLLTHWGKRILNEKTVRYISGIAGCALVLFGLRFAYYAIITIVK